MQRILHRHIMRRVVLCLAVAGTLVAASIGLAPGAHAQAAAPSVVATVHVLPGGYDVFAVGGVGFTPGATVSIEVVNTVTGAVLATIPVPAVVSPSAGTLALVCTGVPVFFFGQLFFAQFNFGPSCQVQLVQLPGTPVVTGTIATTFAIALSTRAVTIVAVDSTTGMASNRIALTF
jgi:hypothetical protein